MTNEELAKILRERVDAQHEAALKAIDVLVPYITEGPMIAASQSIPKPRENGQNRRFRGVSATHQVVDALRPDKWMTVNELANVTGLPHPKIRAVLYAKNRDDLGIELRKAGGRADFRIKREEEDSKKQEI